GPRPFASATNRPRSSNRPRRWPSRTAVRKMFVATSRETESSVARSWTSIVPRAVAYAAACTSARSRALSLRAYPRKYRPGMRKRNAHSVAAATLISCWSTAPAAARMPPTPARASETVPSRSYKVRRFTRTPSRQSTTRVPRNGWPRIADRSASGSRPWTTLNGVRSRATTRAATESRREQPPVEPRDRDAELIERPFADAETPARLDVIPGDPPAAGHDEEFHARRDIPQSRGEISQIPGVVVAGNEDGSAQRNDDFLHVDAVSTQKVMND